MEPRESLVPLKIFDVTSNNTLGPDNLGFALVASIIMHDCIAGLREKVQPLRCSGFNLIEAQLVVGALDLPVSMEL
jgi:hypothetical protein